MAVLLNPSDRHDLWFELLSAELPDMEIRDARDGGGDLDDINYVVQWRHSTEALHRYPNLRGVLNTGAGFDHIDLTTFPAVPVVRLIDPAMADDIALYVLSWVVHFQRDFDEFAQHQATATWRHGLAERFPRNVTVGVFGRGVIGSRVLEVCATHGFGTIGWSRSDHDRPLLDFMADCDVVVDLVPKSPATIGIIGATELAALDDGVLINVGRGATVDTTALLSALDGPLRAAVLDVFDTEPLPADSPLWTHPRVIVTPHVAGRTDPHTAAGVIADSIRQLERAEMPAGTIPGTG